MNNKELQIGIVGLGQRGYDLLKEVLLPQGVRIAAVCDCYADRRDQAAELVTKAGQAAPTKCERYEDMLSMDAIRAVVIASSWDTHIPYACEAMRAGKYAAMEVGGAYSVEDCWKLVRTYEETGTECMIMENCCYGRDELMVLNMVRQGLFGEIVHCEGGYRHDLRDEVAYGRENRHYRFLNYRNRNCENYPTHELGPIANVLNLNRGNRMLSLVSVASRSAGLHDYLLREKGEAYDATNMTFAQGDVVTTIITCAHGETITMTLDTTLPRFYSRAFTVQGTRGMYMEDNHSIYLDSRDRKYDFSWREHWGNADSYRGDYEHPTWKRYLEGERRGGHGGMDWIEFEDFFAAVRDGAKVPLNVYDAASWMAITPLSEQSIAMGGMPAAIPDFTGGRWMKEAPWHPYLES